MVVRFSILVSIAGIVSKGLLHQLQATGSLDGCLPSSHNLSMFNHLCSLFFWQTDQGLGNREKEGKVLALLRCHPCCRGCKREGKLKPTQPSPLANPRKAGLPSYGSNHLKCAIVEAILEVTIPLPGCDVVAKCWTCSTVSAGQHLNNLQDHLSG